MEQKLAIPRDKISHLCLEYYTAYGTTMAGTLLLPLVLQLCCRIQ